MSQHEGGQVGPYRVVPRDDDATGWVVRDDAGHEVFRAWSRTACINWVVDNNRRAARYRARLNWCREADKPAPAAVPAKKRHKAKGGEGASGPGYEGRRDLVTETVESPYAGELSPEHPMRFEPVTRNARHDPIEQLFHQRRKDGGRLIGQGEREAGREVRRLVEALGLDAVKSIVMDGGGRGGVRVEIADHRIDAGRKLQRLRAFLGADMTALLVRVAGYGETISICAKDFEEELVLGSGICSSRARDRTGFMLRLALERAADFFGYGAARGGHGRGVVSWMGEGARPAVAESYREGGEKQRAAKSRETAVT
ncbi:hypothetical protein [Amorphus sp. 3PC139-8]|uniref:hypothetical protein n=1 Tax=Amorphus sp. 3PC139-8 TaxID=2735676 RepID=UPI00345C8720